MQHRVVGATLALGVAWLCAFWLEVPWLNGPWYWRWPWRTIDVVDSHALFLGPLAVYGFLVWAATRSPQPAASDVRAIVAGLSLFHVFLLWTSLRVEPAGFLDAVVRSAEATSYYTDAAKITDLSSFLRDYSFRRLEHHTSTHPPGPVLYFWAWIQLVGPDYAARAAGIGLALLTSAGVPLAYRFAKLWTAEPIERLGACFVYALMPALVAFTPLMDTIYPIFTMAAFIFCERAVTNPRNAVWLGLTLFVFCNMAYQAVTLAAPLALYAVAVLHARGWEPAAWRSVSQATQLAFVAWLGAFLALALLTPFEPLDSYLGAVKRQERYAAMLLRPYLQCLVFDLYDFLLGNGLIALPLLALYLRGGASPPRERAIALAGLASIAIVDLTGLLRCEASRVWLYLQPFAVAPAGVQLMRLEKPARWLLLGLQALVLIAIKCKLHILRVL